MFKCIEKYKDDELIISPLDLGKFFVNQIPSLTPENRNNSDLQRAGTCEKGTVQSGNIAYIRFLMVVCDSFKSLTQWKISETFSTLLF